MMKDTLLFIGEVILAGAFLTSIGVLVILLGLITGTL